MGLADFLAEAGANTVVGHVARAAGGKTTRQSGIDSFINNDLPALADQLHKAATKEDVMKVGQALITSGLKAGLNPQGLDKLMEMTVGPALQNLQQGEIDKLRQDYGAQPAKPAQFTVGGNFANAPLAAPPSGPAPITPSGNFADARPEKPLDLNFAMRLGQATGANPEQFGRLLSTPAELQAKQLSNQKTQSQLDAEKARESAIQGLPSEAPAPGLPSAQAVARINPAGIAQFLPQREQSQSQQDYQNQLAALKEQGMQNALSMANQRIGAANDRANLATSRAGFNQEAELRKEFQSQSKNFQQVRDSYNRINASAQSTTPAGDLSMLYNYMKMLDPGSVVRESEFASAATAKPLMERLGLSWDAVRSVWGGKKMTPGQRADFLNRANQLYNTEAQQHGQRVKEYQRLSTESGLNPSHVITDMGAIGQAPPAQAPTPAGQGRYSEGVPSGSAPTGQGGAPAIGTISKGYRFKGGNPADKNNWEKVQ